MTEMSCPKCLGTRLKTEAMSVKINNKSIYDITLLNIRDLLNFINNLKLNNEEKEISFLVLKGRQQGFTTLITAYQLACSILKKNFQGFTLADKSDNSETIFQNKAKFPYSQLPKKLKPTEKFNNRKQFLFDKINSSWAVDTATKDVGRSRTINFLIVLTFLSLF